MVRTTSLPVREREKEGGREIKRERERERKTKRERESRKCGLALSIPNSVSQSVSMHDYHNNVRKDKNDVVSFFQGSTLFLLTLPPTD